MKKNKLIFSAARIEHSIYVLRGRRVILDHDLAALYDVETKNLNKAVNRNRKRFPDDFIFQLTQEEWSNLKFQFGTSSANWGGRRKLPMAFTEHGVAMAANMLKSGRAVEMSVEIVRAFIRLREFMNSKKEMGRELSELKSFLLKHSHANDREFQRIWSAIEKLSQPSTEHGGRKIGYDIH